MKSVCNKEISLIDGVIEVITCGDFNEMKKPFIEAFALIRLFSLLHLYKKL